MVKRRVISSMTVPQCPSIFNLPLAGVSEAFRSNISTQIKNIKKYVNTKIISNNILNKTFLIVSIYLVLYLAVL